MKVENLKEGDRFELVNGNVVQVDHVFTKNRDVFLLMSNYHWHVFLKGEEVKPLEN